MRPPLSDSLRRLRGWLIPAALLALTPKCVLCLLAYAGMGGALGLSGPELCGATDGPTGYGLPVVLGAALGSAGLAVAAWRRQAAIDSAAARPAGAVALDRPAQSDKPLIFTDRHY